MKLFIKRILLLIPIPILIALINYIEDPANLFSKRYEYDIADYMAQGQHVTNLTNYKDRLLQKYFIEKMGDCPTDIILGSSTVMTINSSFFNEKHLINNGVSGATLEDYLAIFYLYETKGCKIEKILIGLSPWLLNDNHGQTRWMDLENEYRIFANKLLEGNIKSSLGVRLHRYVKYEELISFSYFKASFMNMINRVDKKITLTDKGVNDHNTLLPDGAIFYGARYRNASLNEIEEKAKIAITDNFLLGNFTCLSEHYKLIFKSFMEYLQKQNIEVEFFLAPYHPIVYDFFKNNKYYDIVFKTEDFYKEFARRYGIKLLGSFDPARYNLNNSNFYDGLHCNEKTMELLIKSNN